MLPFVHPPVELASFRSRGGLDLDGWIDFAAICCCQVLHFGIAETPVPIRTCLRFVGKRVIPVAAQANRPFTESSIVECR